jgi:hypothetical protein
MDNISKYPKDWYRQMTRNAKTCSESEPNKAAGAQENKGGSKRNSTGSETVKDEETKEVAEEPEETAE